MTNQRAGVKRADLVYDVGMHKGEDTDYYLQKGFRVVGFEADPELAAHCRRRFSAEIDDGRLVVVEGAIVEPAPGRAAGTVRFYKNTEFSVWGTVAGDWAERNDRLGGRSDVIEVPAIDFGAQLEQHGIPHYMKVDIEGMDTLCLESLEGFEHKPDFVSIESEKVSFEKLIGELALFRRLGYTKFQAVPQRGISARVEPDPSREGRRAGYRFEEGSSGLFGADLSLEWRDYNGVLREYKSIFTRYRWLGDDGLLLRNLAGKVLWKAISLVAPNAVPGWYDTHAKHASAAHI